MLRVPAPCTCARAVLRRPRRAQPPAVRRTRFEFRPRQYCGVAERGAQDAERVLAEAARLMEEDPGSAKRIADRLSPAVVASIAEVIEPEKELQRDPVTPAQGQLTQVAVAAGIPFVGFGVLDNALMIVFGEWIDVTLCVSCGFTTMAAAALGNTLSDAGGVFTGGAVEEIAARAGYTPPQLSRAQEGMDVTKIWEKLGQLIGVVVGCLIGMFPLLLMDTTAAEMKRRGKAMDDLWQDVIDEVAELLNAEACMMMMVDKQTHEMYTRISSESIEQNQSRDPAGKGVKGEVARTGRYMNIEDVRETRFFDPGRHTNYKNTGIDVRSILCMPILDPCDDSVWGVVEVVNKQGATTTRTGTTRSGFTHKDEDVLSALCSHVTTCIGTIEGSDNAFRQTMKLCKRALTTKGTRLIASQNSRNEAVSRELIQEVSRVLEVEASQLLLVDELTGELKLRVSTPGAPDVAPHSAPGSVLGQVVTRGKAVVVDDVGQGKYKGDARWSAFAESGLRVRNLVSFPIISSSDEVVGVLECINKKGSPFSTDDISFLGTVVGHCALNLEGPGSSIKTALKIAERQRALQAGERRAKLSLRGETVRAVLERAFDEVDVNKDGLISREEWNAAASNLLSNQRTVVNG